MNNKPTRKRAVVFMRAREIGAFGLRDRFIERAMIAAQCGQCMEAARRLNAAVIREYEEHGGAGRLDKRPELHLMLDELRALRDVDYLIVTSPDRLARSTADWAAIRFELEAAGAELVIADEACIREEVPV